jgi:hypothetical protein
VPYEDGIPDYLIDFVENDPNFYPEIHTNNLEEAFLKINADNLIDSKNE